MIHEEICTYEVAKLAKEKGFDVPTDRYYHIYDDVIEAQNSLEMTGDGCADFYNSLNRYRCAAPTQSLLQRWLREEKKWNIVVRMYEDKGYYWFIQNSKGQLQESYFTYADEMFVTYEVALEDALKYTLEKLV